MASTSISAAMLSSLSSKSSNLETWLFMSDNEEVYVVGKEDVDTVVQLCPNLLPFVKRGDNNQSMLLVKKNNTERIVSRILFDKGRRVVVLQEVRGNWERRYSGTSSDLGELTRFWPMLHDHVSVDSSMALCTSKMNNKTGLGVFVLCRSSNKIILSSFIDNQDLDNLQSLVLQVNPADCLVTESDNSSKALNLVLSQTLTKIGQPKLKTNDARKIINAMKDKVDLEKHDINSLEADHKSALLAGALLLDEVVAWEGEKFKIEFMSPSDHMCLSHSTLEGLDVFSPDSTLSLFKLLNRTRTSSGERLLSTWIRQPLKSTELIRERQIMVECLVDNESVRKVLYEEHLRRMSADLERLALKIARKKAGLLDIFKAYCSLIQLEKTLKILQELDCKPLDETVIKPLLHLKNKWHRFVQMVEETLDLDSVSHQNQPRIKPTFDEGLEELATKLDKLVREMTSLVSKDACELKMDEKNLKLENTAQHGYFYRVTLTNERALRKEKSNKNIVYLDSNKSGVKFRTLKLNMLAERHQRLTEEYDERQQSVISEVMVVVETYCKIFIEIGAKIAHIDCLVALATAAVTAPIPYVKPELNEEGIIDLKQVRHPTVETMDGVNFIPNDLQFRRDEREFLVITGPNMGGKSTYMRSVALTVLMTQVGSFVPCESANVCPVDNILVRIGASDCQKEGLSTFMVEMLDAARILRCATKSSLVLIDELGRGTSTSDGFGLAWAISEHLSTEIRCFGLFATHFFEMTDLAKQVDTVKNVYCDALSQDGSFVLLYTIKDGVCKKSFGIEVAKIAGFPDEVVQDAQKYLEIAEEEEERALKMRKLDNTASVQ